MKRIFFLLLVAVNLHCFSQDINYAHSVIDTLSSPFMHGRGYTFDGDRMAAKFIASELQNAHIQHFNDSYFQKFYIYTNVFPDEMSVIINNKKLIPGIDFIVDAHSCPVNGTFKVEILDKNILSNHKKYQKFKNSDHSKNFILVDTTDLNDKSFNNEYQKIVSHNTLKAKGIINRSNHLVFIPSQQQNSFAHIIIADTILPKKIKKITVNIDAIYERNYQTSNVIGYIKGEVDTFIVLTAHLDHLGTMGKNVFFPGAHDNASGCAMVLNLAKYYSMRKCKPHYGLVFMFFSGEELGLLGSRFYTEHPLFPLSKIKFLINLDLMGSGDEGVQIVNSTIYKNQYDIMLKINEKYKLLPQIKKRGPAANSDHYFFYVKGVPSFFIYSLGKYKQYHNVFDNRENIPLSGYEQMFKLFRYFIDELNSQTQTPDNQQDKLPK